MARSDEAKKEIKTFRQWARVAEQIRTGGLAVADGRAIRGRPVGEFREFG